MAYCEECVKGVCTVPSHIEVTCPFCGESGFDKKGLKSHLLRDCETYSEIENIQRFQR